MLDLLTCKKGSVLLPAQDVKLRTGPLNYLFMHTGEAGAYCLGVFDNGASGTLLGGISFRNILVQVHNPRWFVVVDHVPGIHRHLLHCGEFFLPIKRSVSAILEMYECKV